MDRACGKAEQSITHLTMAVLMVYYITEATHVNAIHRRVRYQQTLRRYAWVDRMLFF